ncbi:PopZ family protein [Mesorhizobium sp. 1M-11]|uniref:PopZ family protein n=1 Tax=Mesorhizobium sp. 1M-11 TaxID=1529006 RepID=UPI0006C73E6A|nr:PopZ family protein [Mesorhizobium sp. 1M-11]
MATAASSAQREPSMEEILASIRRIIEDSDTGRKSTIETVETRQDDEVATTQSAPVEAPEVDAFRSELHAETPNKPVSLAEVQAQLAAEAPEPRPAASVITLAEIGTMTASERSTPQPVADREEAAGQLRAAWPREVEIVSGTKADEALEQEDAVFATQPDNVDTIREQAEFGVQRAAAVETAALRPSLISEHTSRQVAASFEELSEAFAGRAKKTFDDMAAEMLRPMLQDWLDNNLPTLVERLVREEIERVARGS